MNKNIFGTTALVGSLFAVGCSSQSSELVRPNVLLIVIDDLGWNDLGCMGSDYYETPNIDGLARQGALFTNGYAACSVSSPSRCSIISGKSPARHGITSWIGDPEGELWRERKHKDILLPASYEHNLSLTECGVAQAMRESGYATYFLGKWHVGDDVMPTDFGFDVNIGGWAAGGPRGGYFSPYENPMLEDGEDGENLSLRLSREAIKQLVKRDRERPFFMMLSYYAVHGAIQCTEQRWSKFRDKAEQMGIEDEGFEEARRLPARKAQDNPVYAGLVNQMDEAVGDVINYLRESGLDQNTVVIFTSDNGGVVSGDSYSTSLKPLRGGKGTQWEGGIRVPMIVYDPTLKSRVVDTPVVGMDIYPTLLEFAGVELRPEQHRDGVSIRPLLEGRRIEDRELFWHFPHYGNQGGEPSSTVRDGDWKLIYYYEDQRMELYNLADDLSEERDLAASEPKRVARMRASLDRYLTECSAKVPEVDNYYTAEERAEWRAKRMETTKKQQERMRKAQLKPDWKPNKDWWGSAPVD